MVHVVVVPPRLRPTTPSSRKPPTPRLQSRARQHRRSNPSKVAQFFSSHPAPGDRARLIRQAGYERDYGSDHEVGDIRVIRRTLQRLPPAPGPRSTSR